MDHLLHSHRTWRESRNCPRQIAAVLLLLAFSISSPVDARTAFTLHGQFLQKRALKGYKVPAGFRWKAQTYSGLLGNGPGRGYWANGRYYRTR